MKVLRRTIFFTTLVNIGVALSNGLSGIIVALGLGAEDRGYYASVFAWFLVAQVIAEMGLFGTAAYMVGARARRGRSILLRLSLLALLQGVAAAVFLGSLSRLSTEEPVADGLLLCAVTLPLIQVAQVGLFCLYGADIAIWNRIRAIQVALYLGPILALTLLDLLSLRLAIVSYLSSVIISSALAWAVFWVSDKSERARMADPPTFKSIYGYSLPTAAWSIPVLINGRIDILILASLVTPAELGAYAVASSVVGIAAPAVAALGNVALPRLSRLTAAGSETIEYRRQALRWSCAIAGVLVLVLVVVSIPFAKLALGPEYALVPVMAMFLIPHGWSKSVRQVSADLLRGIGRPSVAARVEVLALPAAALAVWSGYALYGIMGAALGVGLVGVVGAAIGVWLAARPYGEK